MSQHNEHDTYIKEFYDETIPNDFPYGYEFGRWFTSARLRLDYAMTFEAITKRLNTISFESCLELGPGPGTWTRILYRRAPTARFTLVDISKEMKSEFALEMRELSNVDYQISDIHDFNPTEQYDLFFSSRAIEYIAEPQQVIEKVYGLLSPGGTAVIVTKNPSHIRVRGASQRKEHTTQLLHTELTRHCTEAGFLSVAVFPVIVRVPLLDRLTTAVSELVFRRNVDTEVSTKLTRLAESYIVVAKK